MTREAVWHQKTPDGATLAIVLLEADDVEAAFGRLATSDAPFDQRFRFDPRCAHSAVLPQSLSLPRLWLPNPFLPAREAQDRALAPDSREA